MNHVTCDGTRPGAFASLFELVESRSGGIAGAAWWGPVIGADEPANDAIADAFGPCLVQDEAAPASDRRLKTGIEDIGTTVYGLPLYRFRYLDGDGVYEGVMADDVLRVKPSAVLYDEHGFMRVDYRSLGLEMRRVA